MPELERTEEQHTTGDTSHLQDLRTLLGRLQATSRTPLDDEAVEAVAEATGASTEYIRLAMQGGEKGSRTSSISEVYYSLDPVVRTPLAAAFIGAIAGLFSAIGRAINDPFQLWTMLMMITVAIAFVPVVRARDQRAAMIGGASFGGMVFFSTVLFTSLFSMFSTMQRIESAFPLIVWVVCGGLAGHFGYAISRQKFGLKDNRHERQELLGQLMELQQKLTAHEEKVAFLSVDIVGSTAMKLGADPLAIEFTFTEYHKYVEMITERNGGKIHSTAGDGVTIVFDDPAAAFKAARTMQSGLPEFNSFRNRINVPIQLRAGIHYGSVVAPEPGATSVNFSRVIDLAAHLQKECPIGGVMISGEAAATVTGVAFQDREVVVDGMPARIWIPRSAPSALGSGATPPPTPNVG